MSKITLIDDGAAFEVLVLKTAKPTHVVLFAAGSGGSPDRHLSLLTSLTEQGCTVIAPYFDRLVTPTPSAEDLLLRAKRLRLALDSFAADLEAPVVGVGHSIGATLLLGLAGGQAWMRDGQRLPIPHDRKIEKLVLFAPPTGYFQAPGALEAVRIPIQAWVGSADSITPSAQIELLRRQLNAPASLDLHVIEGAGHFSFMNTLPPQIADPMPDRKEFLGKLAAEVGRFITA